MKATLQFNDEEEREAKMAMLSQDIYCALWNASQGLAKLVNDRGDLDWTEAQEDAIREVIGRMSETLDIFE